MHYMDATYSAVPQYILSQAPQVNNDLAMNHISLWIDILGVTTAVLGIFFTIALAIIAILTWKQNELRKQAEDEVQKISKIVKNMNSFAGTTKRVLAEMKNDRQQASSLLSSMGSDVAEVVKITKKMQAKDANLESLAKSITDKTTTLNNSLTSLATLPAYDTNSFLTKGAYPPDNGGYESIYSDYDVNKKSTLPIPEVDFESLMETARQLAKKRKQD